MRRDQDDLERRSPELRGVREILRDLKLVLAFYVVALIVAVAAAVLLGGVR